MPYPLPAVRGRGSIRAPAGLSITDSFNRADNTSSLGNTDTGQAWTAHIGTWGINTNQAYLATDGGGNNVATVDAAQANVAVQVTFAVFGSQGGQRLIFRFNAGTDYLYVERDSVIGKYSLGKRVSGAETELGSYTTTPTSGDVLKVNANGSNLTVYLNGVSRITATDSFNSTATRHGIGVLGSDINSRWDDFSITDAS